MAMMKVYCGRCKQHFLTSSTIKCPVCGQDLQVKRPARKVYIRPGRANYVLAMDR